MTYGTTVEQLQNSSARFELLSDIGGDLLRYADPTDSLQSIFNRLSVHLQLEFYCNYLVDPEHGTFNLSACGGIAAEISGDPGWLAFGQEMCDGAASERCAVMHPDVQDGAGTITEFVREHGITAVICHPLIAHGRLLGTLLFGTRVANGFTDEDSDLLGVVSNQVALALDRARLTTELRRRADDLAVAVKSSEENLAQLEAVLASLDEGVVIADLQGNVIMANPAALQMHGFASVEECRAHQRNLRALFAANYLGDGSVPIREWPADKLARGESFANVEARVRRLDTGKTWIGSYSGRPVRSKAGEIILIAITMRDITGQKQAEQDLKAAKIAAEEANNGKDRFIAILSHELRTPLTPVLTLAQALEAELGLPEELRPYVEVIRRNVDLQVHLIDDLLDLTRINRAKMKLDLRRIDLHELIGQVADICRGDIEAKSLVLVVELRAQRHHVHGDMTRLHQVFWNLLKNAVKFTPEGGTITIGTADSDAGSISVTITDTGIGITAGRLPYIFNEFEQGDGADTHRGGGLGLGLAITRGLVELHGGSITAFSAGSGTGTAFTVLLQAG